MRILQVRFKNLNSLVGEWTIDLTHPTFVSDGIFAIVGPTGAGKTTILDAICLALYGRTPRLNRVTKGVNEIMSRQTGECFAEVSFETQAGRFRCHWSQHRSRKKPDGELQSPKHEIANADTGHIVETKIRGVAEQIIEVTGMDFERFTRSMLLAQGGFDAFLKADADKRAPILEQITGTEIYSRISMRVHESRAKERSRLETLLAELNGMILLSAEDEQHLSASMTDKLTQEAALNQGVAQTTQALAWLDGINTLEHTLLQVEQEQREWQQRFDLFQPENEKLQRANRALELASEYAGLSALRREQAADQKNKIDCLELLPEKTLAVSRDEVQLRLATTQLEERKSEQKAAALIIRNVRELDLKLREKNQPIKSVADSISMLQSTLETVGAKHDEANRELSCNNKTLSDLLQRLDETKGDERLVEQLAGISSRFDLLKRLNQQQKTKVDDIKVAESQLAEATRIWSEQSVKLTAQRGELDLIQGKLSQKQLELKNSLDGRALPEWRSTLLALNEQKSKLEAVSKAFISLQKSKSSLLALCNRHDALTVNCVKVAEQLDIQLLKQAAHEREVGLLETNFSLHKKIQSYEQARQQLSEGDACPLCGAKEHPFAEGNIPQADETMVELSTAREALKASRSDVVNLRINQTELDKDLEQAALRMSDYANEIATTEALISEGRAALSLDSVDDNLSEVLLPLQQTCEHDLNRAAGVVATADRFENEINNARDAVENQDGLVSVLAYETQSADHKRQTAIETVKRLSAESLEHDVLFQAAHQLAQQEILVYGVQALSVDKLQTVQAELTARRDQWLARNKEKLVLESAISAMVIKTSNQAVLLKTTTAEINKLQEQLGALQQECDHLSHQRIELFGDKNPDDEEARSQAVVESAEKQLDSARQALNLATLTHSKLTDRLAALETSIAGRNHQIMDGEAEFQVRLGLFGFVDEASYVAACLPEDDRNTLMQNSQQLSKQQTELESKARDKTSQLEIEREKRLTEQPREEIELERTTLIDSHKVLQQEVGAIRQKLTDNENLKLTQQERTNAIEAQRRECSRWDLLHELIGSADGKKYRNFAQGLTFEMMVGHANRQLHKMTDRYLLIRDETQPLELNVIDNYQAGETRSTKNLSGGESFIVSLSLALGLSHMASKNVRVDSLFLDEGFGTLDEEALETALETLSGLQQNGKLIGVISHVTGLKERISSQITITPQTGGRSIISGPGCTGV